MPLLVMDIAPKILTGDIFEAEDVLVSRATGSEGRTRPVLKIQDGCNNRCAYCVIPFVRGRSRSLAPERVKQEVCALVAAGAREIVLSGINLGAYGRDLAPRAELRDLLARLLDETPVERIRLSSIEPMDLTLDLVELVVRHSGRIAPHFHVPLQSGSDRMLAAMHRWYRAAHYAERILLAAERVPGAGIGADVICGFPGETPEDHKRTVEFIERLPFSYLHVFSYSSRPGTRAAEMAGAVPPAVIRERARELRALSAKKAAEFRAAQSGTRQRVLTLERSGVWPDGSEWTGALTGNYLHVRVAGRWPRNQWLDVRLWTQSGELCGEIPDLIQIASSSDNLLGY
jgi:threonylcarbamoyladenosine tRNA methylthiotransferase MtaB